MSYWDNLWVERQKRINTLDIGWNYEKRRIDSAILSLLRKLVVARDHVKILEVGIGKGDLALKISSQLYITEISYVGIDISKEGIKIARRIIRSLNSSKFEFLVADGTHLPFRPRNFDIVICSEVIEHIADKEALLREIKSALNMSGLLILTTPNPNALIYTVPKLLSKMFKMYRFGASHPFNELILPEKLTFLLEKAGFEIVYRSGLVLSSYITNLMEMFFRVPLTPLRKISEGLENFNTLYRLTLYQVILAKKKRLKRLG